MGYDPEEIEQKAIGAIEEHDLYFITDIIPFLPCSRATFYNLGLDKVDNIKEALEKNKINAKIDLRKKWLQSDNATMQMGIMKLLSSDEELKKLAMEYKEHSGKVNFEKIEVEIVNPKDKG